jgi:hypothetical protein
VLDVLRANAELIDSSIVDSWGRDWVGSFAGMPVTMRVIGEGASLWLIDSNVSGSAGVAVLGNPGTWIKMDGGSLTDNQIGVYSMGFSSLNTTIAGADTALLRNGLANWLVDGPDAFAQIDNADFRGGTFGVRSYDNAGMTVSNSTSRRVSRPLQFESIDSSRNSNRVGHNLYFYGGASNYASIAAHCTGDVPVRLIVTGSDWRPNTQGSDANGHFASQTIKGVKKGNNYWLKDSICQLVVN